MDSLLFLPPPLYSEQDTIWSFSLLKTVDEPEVINDIYTEDINSCILIQNHQHKNIQNSCTASSVLKMKNK